ncbi:lipopolysaccharide biosynthesis protein [Ancylomarina longa]|uniref:Uncharacterized protein n=1 Tax=Ancylomarina longa TaxID=2487017 RepID=A0A434AWF9_9BACT|nr:polysaccharide biosynthesis C-terminal domain-containing protein [Ancylomarina longa]RUT78839.1 hypothetical protein DLK05_06830 [Ancylomarina longa]
MNPLKKLAGETAIYGLSSIIGRFLNWLLVPFYTGVFLPEEYGIVTNLMSYVAILLVVLTYGMETGYFRFASSHEDSSSIFSTSVLSILFTTVLFWLAIFMNLNGLARFLSIENHSEFILLLAITLGLDAITALPFAKLRQENRAVRYAGIKLGNIAINLGLNLFFLWICPWISKTYPNIPIDLIWNKNFGIGYIFVAFMVSSLFNLIVLLPEFRKVKLKIDKEILLQLLKYSGPILVVSICGMININLDKMIMPQLIPEHLNPLYQTGIYGANYKLAVIMTMFIQAFRYAFEPFFFAQAKMENSKQVYADVLKYFVVFGLLIFLSVLFYLDLVKIFINSRYHEGLGIVPYVLLANFFFGIFFSLSLWYKLTDKTKFGAYIAIIGSVITIVLNVILVPRIGYFGAAYAVLVCFVVMTVISYIWGQKYYPVPYDLKRILFYIGLALLLYLSSLLITDNSKWMRMLYKTPLLLCFLFMVFQKEKLWHNILRIFQKQV